MMERLWGSASMGLVVRRKRQTITLALLAALSVTLVIYAYLVHRSDFGVTLALSLGTNLVIVIATYLIFNPLVEQVRTTTTHEHPRLDHDAFIEHVDGSRAIVCILTTWTTLLDDPYRQRFLSALRVALNRSVLVQILLLDPTSKAAEVRAEELHQRDDFSRSIMTNLRHLEQFRIEDLNERMRPHLQVRIYSAAPSVLLYRWDHRAYVSFFAMGRLTDDTPKLETFVTTPWADFVRRRFDELWNDTTTMSLERYFRLPLVVCDRAGTRMEFEVDYINLEGVYYIATPSLTDFTARHGINNLSVIPSDDSADTNAPAYTLTMLDDLPNVRPSVRELFQTKYEQVPAPVFCVSGGREKDR